MTASPIPADAPGLTRTLGQRVVNIYGNFFGTINMGDQIVESRTRAERKLLLQAVRDLVEAPLNDQLGGPPLPIPLESHPSAVSGRSPEEGLETCSLPPGTPIAQAFQQERQKLLVLGEGGSGKTTALRMLALSLVAEAEADESKPVPVFLGLGSWGAKRLRLDEWLVYELSRPGPYEQSARRASWWIQQEKVLPLLWGLDRVESEHQAACLDEINRYRESRDFVRDMAVTCRSDDYETLSPRRLSLRGAVRLGPLTPDQIDEFLAARGLDALRADIAADPTLREMATSPLMLGFLAAYYHDHADPTLPGGATSEERLNFIVDGYVKSRLRPEEPEPPYAPEDVTCWLGWIARSLPDGERTFYLDRLQPDWLPVQTARRLYALTDRIGTALFVACLFGLLFGSHFFARSGPGLALVGGLVGALVGGLVGGQGQPITGAGVGPVALARRALTGLAAVGVAASLITAFTPGGANLILVAGIAGGLVGALAAGLGGGPSLRPRAIRPLGPLDWSPRLALRHATGGFFIGSTFGALVGLIGARIGRIEVRGAAGQDLDEVRMALLAMLLVGALFGLIAALGFGLVGGLTSGIVEEQRHPNQAIRRSARRALQVFGGVTFITVPLATLVLVLIGGSPQLLNNVPFALQAGLLIGPILGIVAGLAFGGYAVLSHAALRLVLWRWGVAPLAYIRFLEYARRRGLLSRAGGGYEFRPGLLEYFASRYEGAVPTPSGRSPG
jgi:hypothetical protein